jgi:hypothetical protein
MRARWYAASTEIPVVVAVTRILALVAFNIVGEVARRECRVLLEAVFLDNCHRTNAEVPWLGWAVDANQSCSLKTALPDPGERPLVQVPPNGGTPGRPS